MKAKVIMVNGDAYIVNKTVEEVTSDIEAGNGVVSLPVTKKVYDKTLSTINIGEPQIPAYQYEDKKVALTIANIQSVVEATEEEASYYTGKAEADSETEEVTEETPEEPAEP